VFAAAIASLAESGQVDLRVATKRALWVFEYVVPVIGRNAACPQAPQDALEQYILWSVDQEPCAVADLVRDAIERTCDHPEQYVLNFVRPGLVAKGYLYPVVASSFLAKVDEWLSSQGPRYRLAPERFPEIEAQVDRMGARPPGGWSSVPPHTHQPIWPLVQEAIRQGIARRELRDDA
jgi:hypothetical protein